MTLLCSSIVASTKRGPSDFTVGAKPPASSLPSSNAEYICLRDPLCLRSCSRSRIQDYITFDCASLSSNIPL